MPVNIQTIPCGLLQVNAYIVQAEGRNDCVVIDPGDEARKIEAAVGDRVVAAILLTHGHFDHIMATGTLAGHTGAPVYVATEDEEMLGDAQKSGYAGIMGIFRADWPPITAEHYGKNLSVAGLDFTVLPTPGHSRGSVCLYLKDEGIMFCGDTMFRAGYGRLDLYGGSMRSMIDSLKKLFALPDEVRAYPGHGDATTIGEERARYRL